MLHVGVYVLYFLNMFFLISFLYLCIIEPLQKLGVRLWPCNITDRSKAMLPLWFLLFYVLVLNYFAVWTLCAF